MTGSGGEREGDTAALSADRVREQLDRILASRGFVQAERIGLFLRYVVEEALAGRGDRLKEYSVAIEVFGRDDSFDPQTSSVVRVEASRLRTKLDEYYREAGVSDSLVIELPRGGYVPIFRSPQTASAGFSDQPSIAVMPFTNMSTDLEQDYFAAGITEDIITALSRVRQFPVIARNSTFSYKDKAVDIRTVANELGARYVMEGSVRLANNRVRVTAQLINGDTGNHIWADRCDRTGDGPCRARARQAQTTRKLRCLGILPAGYGPPSPAHQGRYGNRAWFLAQRHGNRSAIRAYLCGTFSDDFLRYPVRVF